MRLDRSHQSSRLREVTEIADHAGEVLAIGAHSIAVLDRLDAGADRVQLIERVLVVAELAKCAGDVLSLSQFQFELAELQCEGERLPIELQRPLDVSSGHFDDGEGLQSHGELQPVVTLSRDGSRGFGLEPAPRRSGPR